MVGSIAPMLELHGVTLWRGDRAVFRNLSLTIKGPKTGLIGSNGSGKSSLLRLLQGLILPEPGGRILVCGPDGAALPAPRYGLVFQNPDHQILFPTVMEELCFGLLEQGFSQEQAEAAAHHVASLHNAQDLLGLATHELSEGQKQRVCILSVLTDQPDILLLDEPFASLDRQTTRQMMDWLLGLAQPLVMASHSLEILEEFDEVVWLEDGLVFAQGQPSAVISAYRARYP
ncbi:MAG: hypothetical protein RLZZ344_557 [Pseudomonadota bacterium]